MIGGSLLRPRPPRERVLFADASAGMWRDPALEFDPVTALPIPSLVLDLAQDAEGGGDIK